MRLSDAQFAVAAAGAGADVVRARYGAALSRIEKSSSDFATEADLESERMIKAVLRAERPADALVGEESGRSGPALGARVRSELFDVRQAPVGAGGAGAGLVRAAVITAWMSKRMIATTMAKIRILASVI
jgi:3'-phosphoadenosine 5'-phosphosulfate (PAPS) 3'-phosphatase